MSSDRPCESPEDKVSIGRAGDFTGDEDVLQTQIYQKPVSSSATTKRNAPRETRAGDGNGTRETDARHSLYAAASGIP